MTKHDKKLLQEDRADTDLLRQIQAAVLAYMADNDGQMPTVAKVHETVKGSYRELTPAVRLVKERLLATQTRLANMPDIPDDLRLAHEQQLKDMWARTRDLQNGEIMDLRRAQAAKDDGHRHDIDEMQAIIADVETRCDQEAARADASAVENAALRADLEAALTALAAAHARLAERDAILAMFAAHVSDQEEDEGPGEKAKPGKIARRTRKPEEPETADLPGISSPAVVAGPEASA